jgi:transaldolase
VFDRTKGRDGYVSLEVTTKEGVDRVSILREARHLWAAVSRPNVLIKVPGSAEGVAAFETLTADGINVNVTLLFSTATYAKVAEAYLSGLEARARKGGDLSKSASVASFFVSRIDTAVDALLQGKSADALLGKTAIANAKVAYALYLEIFSGPRWAALAAKGARTQRVLWASTSTKNKSYRDVMYVEELVGPETVNTMPLETIRAFQEHGEVRGDTVLEGIAESRKLFEQLAEAGVDYDDVTDTLEEEGVQKFSDSFDQIVDSIREKRGALAAA